MISRFTIYCENGDLETLRKIIKEYIKDISKTEAGRRLGFTRMSAASSINDWSVHGKIPLKHLKTICEDTDYDIKNFLRRRHVRIEGTYSHKEVTDKMEVLKYL